MSGGMLRGEWLALAARTLVVPEATIRQLYREARRIGVVSSGARGVNAKPLDLRERKDFLEFVAVALCVGSVVNPLEKGWQKGVGITWAADELVAEKPGGIRMRVVMPGACLRILLAADLS